MIFIILSCVLYMTLMMFIYMYYELFTCTNLVDVIPLFFMIFFVLFIYFQQKSVRSRQKSSENRHAGFLKN
jgi:hypothetical protein